MINKLKFFAICSVALCILTTYKDAISAENTTADFPGIAQGITDTDKGFQHLLDLETLSEYRSKNGIKDLEPHSIALLEKGVLALEDDQKAKAITFFEAAIELSPNLPRSYLHLAKASFSFSPEGFSNSAAYLLDAWNAILNNIWWSFRIAGSLLASFFISLYVTIIIFTALLLSSRFRIYLHDIVEDRRKIFIMIPSVILVFFGPIFGIFAFIMPLWIYLKKKEKILIYTLFSVFAAAILIIPSLSIFLNAYNNVTLRSIINVNSGIYTGDTAYFLEGRDDYESTLTYALVQKRNGKYNEAIKTYKGLLGRGNDAKIYNNIANCYVGLNEYKRALAFYDKSLQSGKLASAYYNISQLKNELFEFREADSFYKKAIDVNSEEVASFAVMRGQTAISSVVDEIISKDVLWDLAFKNTPGKGFNNNLGRMFTFVSTPLSFFLLLIIAVAVTVYDRKTHNRALRCQRCGRFLCSICEEEPAEDDTCSACFKTLSSPTELSPKERTAKMIEINRYREKRNSKLRMMTLILPGSGHIYLNNLIPGFLILFSFVFLVSSALVWSFLIPSVSMAPLASVAKWLSVAGALALYINSAVYAFGKEN